MKSQTRRMALLLVLALLSFPLLTACGTQSAAPAASPSPLPSPTPKPSPVLVNRHRESETAKEETVYIRADADGSPQSITVETVLHYAGENGEILDRTRLTDIRNTEGDEEFKLAKNGTLVWEDHGEDIRYEGKSDLPLPVGVTIQCFLDDRELAPQELAGKSGHLRMRFEYVNNTAVTVPVNHYGTKDLETCIPFLAMTIVMLPEEVFANAKADNGKLLSLGDQSLFLGYGLPGLAENLSLSGYKLTKDMDLPAYAELEADVTDFHLDFTATIFSNKLLTELELGDLDDLDRFADGMDALSQVSGALTSGTKQLSDGAGQLADLLAQYVNGVSQLSQGAQGLNGAISGSLGQLNAARDALSGILSRFAAAPIPNVDQASTVLLSLADSLAGLQAQLQSLSAYPESVSSALANVDASLSAPRSYVEAALNEMALEPEQADAILAALDAGVSDIRGTISGIPTDGAAAYSADIEALQSAAASLQSQAESTAASLELLRSPEEAQQILAQIAALCAGLDTLSGSAASLARGTVALDQNSAALRGAAEGIRSGSQTLSDGVGQFGSALGGITELGDWRLRVLLTELRAMRLADLDYNNFGGIAEGRTGSVRFLVETDEIKA
ncbi:MAG: hypothetical protein J5927_07730 [Oscillospiraceae bacterium]|nr:hypothetical protein [Oscillospiraceae bacterium]